MRELQALYNVLHIEPRVKWLYNYCTKNACNDETTALFFVCSSVYVMFVDRDNIVQQKVELGTRYDRSIFNKLVVWKSRFWTTAIFDL